LRAFEVVYVADVVRLQAAAERKFNAFLGLSGGAARATATPIGKRLIEHFEARFLYEQGDLSSFSREKLIRLRKETAEFSEPKSQELYEHWKAGANPRTNLSSAPSSPPSSSSSRKFSTYLLGHDYSFFGSISSRGEVPGGPDGPTPRAAQGVGAVVGTSLRSRET
jgi:hypothetical protein